MCSYVGNAAKAAPYDLSQIPNPIFGFFAASEGSPDSRAQTFETKIDPKDRERDNST